MTKKINKKGKSKLYIPDEDLAYVCILRANWT